MFDVGVSITNQVGLNGCIPDTTKKLNSEETIAKIDGCVFFNVYAC